jgi:hypothetical protein
MCPRSACFIDEAFFWQKAKLLVLGLLSPKCWIIGVSRLSVRLKEFCCNTQFTRNATFPNMRYLLTYTFLILILFYPMSIKYYTSYELLFPMVLPAQYQISVPCSHYHLHKMVVNMTHSSLLWMKSENFPFLIYSKQLQNCNCYFYHVCLQHRTPEDFHEILWHESVLKFVNTSNFS